MKYSIDKSNLGYVLICQTDVGICALFLGDDPRSLLDELHMEFGSLRDPPLFYKCGEPAPDADTSMIKQVISYIEDPKQDMKFKLDMKGTNFQKRVWNALLTLNANANRPKTITYGEIANMIGAPKSVRAVAGACASNRIAVLIPCHKVVRKDGKPSGYRWGIDLKNKLNTR